MVMNLFIDTNVFLSFFHLSNDDLNELHKLTGLLENKSITLWLTEQVCDEFFRNRENKISEAVKKLSEQRSKPQFPQICKDYEEYPAIRELQKSYDQKLSALIAKINKDISERTLKADQQIAELFSKAAIINNTEALVSKARLRMDIGNPPGKNGSLGDAINWEALLENVPKQQKLYLIADDKDYFSILDEDKPKDFLRDEWSRRKDADVIFYRRISQFFKVHHPEIKLASELEKEIAIRGLAESRSFAETHSAISKISRYLEFSKSQASEIAQVALSNSQVNWIICDPDVFDFYSVFLQNCSACLESGLREQLAKELAACNKTEEKTEPVFDCDFDFDF
jgi:predicted nucleic acid-binding protein